MFYTPESFIIIPEVVIYVLKLVYNKNMKYFTQN